MGKLVDRDARDSGVVFFLTVVESPHPSSFLTSCLSLATVQPIQMTINELQNPDIQLRLNSIRRIGSIAQALGPERARGELVPLLAELDDDEDEVSSQVVAAGGQGPLFFSLFLFFEFLSNKGTSLPIVASKLVFLYVRGLVG